MTDVANLSNGKASGGILSGPLDVVLPVDAATPFAETWMKLGLVGEDGLSPSGERTIADIRDWNGDEIESLQTEHTSQFEFTLLEVFNEEVQKAVFGEANVTVTPATATSGKLITVNEDGAELDHKAYGFDMAGTRGKRIRILVPDGKIVSVEENAFTSGDLNSFKVTVKTYRKDGIKVIRYYDDGKKTVA